MFHRVSSRQSSPTRTSFPVVLALVAACSLPAGAQTPTPEPVCSTTSLGYLDCWGRQIWTNGIQPGMEISGYPGEAPGLPPVPHVLFYWRVSQSPGASAHGGRITIHYVINDLPADLNVSDVTTLYWYDENSSQWLNLLAAYSLSTQTLWAHIDEMKGLFTVGAASSLPEVTYTQTPTATPIPTSTPTYPTWTPTPTFPCERTITVSGVTSILTCTPTPVCTVVIGYVSGVPLEATCTPIPTPTACWEVGYVCGVRYTCTPIPTETPTDTPTEPSATFTSTPTTSPRPTTPLPSQTPLPTETPTPTEPPPAAYAAFGGYMDTALAQNQNGVLHFLVYVPDCTGPTVELATLGVPAGVFLYDDGTHGDGEAGDCLFGQDIALSGSSLTFNGRFLIEVLPGIGGAFGNVWPYLTSNGP